jgi:site-specific DNA-cytosine methylase
MAERPLYTLYKNLKAQNYDVPDDYNKFESALTRDGKGGADNRHAIYENLKAQNFDVPSTYERFYSALFEPRSKTSSRAKGGSVPMTAADRARFSAGAAAISASAQQTMNNAGRYNRLKQRKQKQQKDFGRVNLGTHKTAFGGDANNVVKDDFAYNPETGKAGAYVTSDNDNAYTQNEAEQKQAILDEQNNAYQQAVDTGEIPSAFDVRDKNGNYDLQENIGKNGTYLTEEGAQKQFDKKLADAYARKKEIEALIAEDNRQHGNPLLSYGASIGASNGRTAEQSDYRNKLATSLSLVTEQIGALEAVKQYPTSSWGEDALKALDNTAFTAKTWDFGLTDFAIMGQMERIKTKMDNKIPLSGSDKMLLKSKLGADAAAALEDEKMGNIYRWTKIAGQSLPFMADFFLTGGYGGITKGISSGALKFAAKRGMGKVSAAILKNTGIVAGDVIGSYAMAGTEQALKTGADIMQRHLGNLYQDEKGDYKFGTFDENGNLLYEGGESMGTALYKGMTSAMVENYTEKLFGHNYGIKKGAVNFMEKHGMNASAEFFKNIGKSGWYTNSKKWMEKFGINGFGEEVMEEEIGIPLHALLDGDNKFSDLLDTKQQLDIIGGMAISVGSMYAMGAGSRPVKGIYNRAQYYRFRNKVNVADIDAQNLMGDNWADIKDKIDNATNEQMGSVLAGILRQRDTMSKEQINAAVNYGVNLMKMRGYNIAKTAEMNAREITNEPTTPEEQHQTDIDNAYSEGHDADDADKHDIQIQQEDQMKTLAAALGISEQQLSAMSDEELESLTGQDDKLDQAIYDYQLSSARYQGVVDDAQDKVDLAAHQAEQRVDMYTDQSRGSVRNATIKASGGLEDYGVYIISGNIATHEDGSIDVSNSDDMILYYDPTTNSVEHADALMFAELGEELPADDVKAQAVTDAKENAIKEIAGIIDGTVEVGSQFNVTDTDGTEHTYEVLADYGDGTAAISIDGNVVENPYQLADLQQMKDLEDQKRLETAKAQREQMEKERAAQQTQETEQTQPSFDFNQILNDNGNVVLVDVLDKDGNTKYPDSKLFLIRDAGAKAKVVELKSDGTIVPHAVNKEDVATISSMSLDEYKQAMPESSMIEDNSGENRGEIEVEAPTIEDAEPIGTGAFGNIYNQFKGKVKEAFNFLMHHKSGDLLGVFHRDDVGDIDLVWGNEKMGLAHILGKHVGEGKDFETPDDAIAMIENVINSGRIFQDNQNRYTLMLDGVGVGIRKSFDGEKKNWIVTAVDFNRSQEEKGIVTNPTSTSHGVTESESTAALNDSDGKDINNSANGNENNESLTFEDGTPIPVDVNGEVDLSQTDAAHAAEWYDTNLGEDADDYLDGEIKKAKKVLEQSHNKKVTGTKPSELVASKKEKETAIANAQAVYDSAISIRDALKERRIAKEENTAEGRKNLIDKARRKFARLKSAVKDDAEAVAQLYKETVGTLLHRLYDGTGIDVTDTIPLTAEEYVASNLGAHSLNYEGTETSKGVKQETGLSREDFAKTQLLAADGKGTTIDNLVHSLWENRPSNLDSLDTQDIRNAMLSVITSGFKASEARNFVENIRIAQAENILEEQKRAQENADYAEQQKAEQEAELKAKSDEKAESEAKSEEELDNESNDLSNESDNEKTNDNINDNINVPEDATDENPLGAQRDESDLPFSAKENGTQQTAAERAADVEKNKVDDLKVVDNIVGQKTRKAFERLAKMMGATIQWQYSDKLGNGWIQETTDADGNVHRTIFITLDSSITEGAQFIFGHEMTHKIKNLNPAAYNELTQLVLDTYGTDAFDKAVDETMKRYSDAGFSGRARDYYAEEVVADAVGEMIRDLNLAHTLAMKMSHPLLAAIYEILQKIKLAFYGTEYSDVTKNIIRSIEQAYVKTANGEVTNTETGEDVSYSLRQKPEPKKKGIGYKVFVLKDGKLYPPMVANPDGAATPVGVWLDADAAPIAGESKTGRPQVKQGGKGTQGGSGKLAYRPGWHLGVVPYAIQFNRKDADGNKTLFPKNFVFAEVEYAADVDYQEEARQEGINPSGKYQHSLAGLKHLPTDGYYMYRTNPNPETDPWVITGAMKVNRILTRAEQADLVSKAGREPQQIQEGDIVTDDVVNSINQEIADAPKFSIKTYHGSQASFDHFDHSFMGSGEGAQAYGWGTYVSEVEGIAKAYAKANAKKNAPSRLMYQGKPMTYKTPSIIYQVALDMDKFNISAKEAISKMIDADEKKLASVGDTPFAKMKAKQVQDELKVLKDLNPSDFKINEDYDTVAQDLIDTKSGLDLLEDELKDAKSYVDLYQSRLDEAKEELSKAKESGTGLGVDMYESDVEYYSEQVKRYKQSIKTKESDIKDVKTKVDALQKKLDSMEKPRNLYSVDIPDDTGRNYIGWDEPLGAAKIMRLPKVFKADGWKYKKVGQYDTYKIDGNEHEVWLEPSLTTGKELYRDLTNALGSDKAASEFLSKAGFVGVKVIAQRNTGGNKEGKMNYVIFDENNAQITSHTKFSLKTKPDVNMESAVSAMIKIAEGADYVPNAVVREDLEQYGGDKNVGFYWGKTGNPNKEYKGGYGLAHIGAKHGEEVIRQILDVMCNGKIDRYVAGNKTAVLSNGKFECVVALTRNGNKESWLLSGWDKIEKAGGNSEVSTQSVPMQGSPTFSRTDLGAALSAAKIDNSSETAKENEEKVDVEEPKTFEEFLNHPSLKFSIKNEEQRKAAEDAYEYASKLRPNKYAQYALVDMSNPSKSPEYYEKKVLADRWRRFYNKAVHNELDDVYKDAWGNYKLFDLDQPFADQVNEVKGDVPSEFNAPDVEANKNADNESGAEYHEYKQDEPSSVTYKDRYKAFKQREANREKTAGLRKELKEVEDSYNSKSEQRIEYNKQLMKEYMDKHGLSSENDIPEDIWNDLRDKSFVKYQDELDSLFNKYKDLDRQIKAVAEPRFSLKDEKTLAGVHNITEEKLRKALKLGGFANPSLAVIDTSKSGHDNFGEISFIAPSALLDKRTGNTGGTWITDAYTQRYPSIEREMSEKGRQKFKDWVDSLEYPSEAKAEIKRQAEDALSNNNAPAWELMYLKEKGIDIKEYDSRIDYRWKEIISDHPTAEDILNSMKTDPELNKKVTSLAKHAIIHPTWKKVSLEVRRKMYKETGVKASPIKPQVRKQTKEIFERDYAPTLLNKDGSPRKKDVKKVVGDIVKEHNDTKKYDFYLSKVKASNYVNKNGLYDDYIRWQENKLDEFGMKNRIFRGYTKDGSRKYVPETLENVSKAMREEADGQTNGSEYTSFGSFIAKLASRVDSTDEMRANKDKLSSNKDKEEFYEKWNGVYYDLAKFLYNDVFYGEQRLHDIVLQSDPKKYAKKEYGITLTPTFMKKLDALKNAVQTELKSAYFETKYNRPLRLNEFAAAVVPDNLGEDVRKGIENAGLPMYDYDPNKEGDRSRAFNEAINSSDNIRFSLKDEKEKIVADAKANGTYMIAPNGEKTKLDAEQWATVRTTNFKNWFGDWENDPENASKVVDENGEPLVAYHGTTNDETTSVWNEKTKMYDTSHEPFTVFKREVDGLPNSGLFFNSSEDNAYEYGYNNYAVYLSAKNPLVIDCKGSLYNSIKHDGKTMDTYDWANWAEENGYDGVIFKNIKDGVDYGSMQDTTDDYVVFKSNQIKSAENNNGDFSADNNDIRFSLKSMMAKPEGWKQANKKAIHIAEAIERDPKFSLKNLDSTLIKAGTYFSGGGLVEEGLKGIIDPVVAVEYDEKISGVYRNNFGQHIVTADVRDVDPKELVKQIDGEVEYFHASPVCKNYSQAKNNHAEVELDKETAASTAEFINAVKPKVVTIENVKGYKDSDAMKTITDALDANGYTWDADVYNAADFGGYTNRERLIVRAVRDGKLPAKPKKMEHKSGWYEAVADIIPTLTEKKNGVAPWMDIRLKADGIDWRNIDKPLYVMGSAYADGKIPHAFADELLPTLRTKSGDVIVMPDGKVYRAMGRVLARVSGVSDDYKMPFSENLSHTIIGNGIPTHLTEHVIAPLLTGSDPKFSIRTYHGTGASFDKFDFSHMGEGEGSQAFGWGGYVTNSKDIAEDYTRRAKMRKNNGGFEFVTDLSDSNKDMVRHYIYKYKDVDKGLDAMRKDLSSALEMFPDDDNLKELSDILAKKNEEIAVPDDIAYLYDVDIPDDNGDYLDWENKLKKSHLNKVNKELVRIGKEPIEAIYPSRVDGKVRGQDLYDELSSMLGSKEAASKLLSDAGFVGIKYPAGTIFGGAKKDDYNYVIFDENNANIVGNTRFSLRYDQFEHDLNQWKKDNNLPKDAQRPTIPQRNAGESAVDFLRRVDEYRKQMALWKTAPTYEQHLLSDDTALGEFNRELQRGSVLKRIAFQDSMLAIRKAQEAIMNEVGVDRLNMAEDAYTAENRSHGKGKNEFEEYNNEFLQPLRKAYHQMKKVLGDSYDNVRIYMMAKHGLERDAQMAFKKSLDADFDDVAKRSAAYRAYKGDMNRIINDSDLEYGRIDFKTWRNRDNLLRTKYSPSYMAYRYDENGIVFDYSGLSALFGGPDFEEAGHKLVRDIEDKYVTETHDLWDATNAATKKILRDGYKAGMMSKDTYQYVRDMYGHYIPLRGWDGTTADQVWDYVGGGKGAFNQTLKTAHGRTSIADDPIAYIENMAESGILLNNKNWVKQHLMLLAQNHPTSLLTLSKAWYVKSTDANGNEEWIPATPQITSQMNSNQVKATIDAFEKKMEQMAATGDATQKRDGLNIAYPQTHSEEREHEVRVMKDGEEYVIYVNGDPQLAQAMNNTRAHRVREIQSGKLDRAAAWLGRKMAAAYTSLSPLFIPSNYFRDLTMTLASTAIREDGRYNYLLRKNMATSWNLGFMLRDYQNGKLREKVSNGNATAKEQMFYDFMMNGGETGFVSSLDVEDLKKKFKNDLKDLDRWKTNPVKVGHTIMDGIEFLNRMIEDSNRFAVYMTSIQYGRSIDEAVNDAKDVTLNFNRKGTGEYGWQMIRNLYLFINPAVQSLQTLGALAKHHPFKFTAVTASWLASGVLVPIVNAALMSLLGGDDDKDKYWQFTKWDRRNNLIMWVPFTHEFVKIPLAQEFRAFYGVGDMIASKMMGGELAEENWSQYAEDLLGQVVDMLPFDPTGYDGNIAVSLMPNAIRPVFELAFNVDFTGKPLFKDTEYNKYDPNFTKAYVGTPDWLVRASRMVNSIGNDYPDVQQNSIDAFGDPRYNLNNPAVVDHVLSSYLGGAYTMGSQVLGVLTKSLNDPKEIKVADIPLFSKFVSNPDDRPVTKKQGDEFWDMKENHDRAANTLSKLKKQAKVDGDYSLLERFYGSEEYKQYKQDDVKVKKHEEDKKKERAEESGEEYRPHKLNAEDIYKAHATPKDDFEDLKLKQLYTKLNGFKSAYDLLVDTAPSQSDGYYNTNKAAIDAIDEISLDKQEIYELKKGFLDDGKDAYNAEDMKQIRELRKKILAVLEKANKVVVANQKAKAEK